MADAQKEKRLKSALRDNLKKRKKALRKRDQEAIADGHNSDKNSMADKSES